MSVLNTHKVLVLNRGWHPVAVISLKRAIRLVSGPIKGTNEPKARIIDATQDFRLWTWADWSQLKAAENESVIRSAHKSCRVPEIILLSKYSGFPSQKVRFSRRTIYKRDNFQCQYCGAKPGSADLSLDHIMPKSRGGKSTWENTCLCCTRCNRKKANRTMHEAGFKFFHPGYKPVKPKFILYKGDYRCKSWEDLLGVGYWECELENDNK